MGSGQNCMKTKLHKGIKLHKETFAQENEIARRQTCTKGQFRIEGHFCKRKKNTIININKNKK